MHTFLSPSCLSTHKTKENYNFIPVIILFHYSNSWNNFCIYNFVNFKKKITKLMYQNKYQFQRSVKNYASGTKQPKELLIITLTEILGKVNVQGSLCVST